jgi:hypothetical protein
MDPADSAGVADYLKAIGAQTNAFVGAGGGGGGGGGGDGGGGGGGIFAKLGGKATSLGGGAPAFAGGMKKSTKEWGGGAGAPAFAGGMKKSTKEWGNPNGNASAAGRAPITSPPPFTGGRDAGGRGRRAGRGGGGAGGGAASGQFDMSNEDMGGTGYTDESNRRRMGKAENLRGLCVQMCPENERQKRVNHGNPSMDRSVVHGSLHRIENVRGDGDLRAATATYPYEGSVPNSEVEMMVKEFRRPAAGKDGKLDVPEHVRTPATLRKVVGYLERFVMDLHLYGAAEHRLLNRKDIEERNLSSRMPSNLETYLYVFDRTRSVRQDFTLQNFTAEKGSNKSLIATEVHERVIRWHILVGAIMVVDEEFRTVHAQQNFEQLGKAMKSLEVFYDSCLGSPDQSPHEGELRSYWLLMMAGGVGGSRGIKQSGKGLEISKYLSALPVHVVNHPCMQLSMEVVDAVQHNRPAHFFALLRRAPLLHACLMQRYVGEVRQKWLRAMNKVGRARTRTHEPTQAHDTALSPLSCAAPAYTSSSSSPPRPCRCTSPRSLFQYRPYKRACASTPLKRRSHSRSTTT